MTTTNFIHRDDVDYPVVERLEKALAGTKVVFAGDLSEVEQSRIRESISVLRKAIGEVNGSEDQAIGFCVGRTAESLNAGSCIFCESEHPKAWTPAASDFDLPRGWGWVLGHGITGFYGVCCDKCGVGE